MTRQAICTESAEIARICRSCVEALDHVGHFQTRSRGTIGGTCCHLDPAAELPALCALYDANSMCRGRAARATSRRPIGFRAICSRRSTRTRFWRASACRAGRAATTYGFSEYARRRGDFAIAGAAALARPGATMARLPARAIVVFGVDAGAGAAARRRAGAGRPQAGSRGASTPASRKRRGASMPMSDAYVIRRLSPASCRRDGRARACRRGSKRAEMAGVSDTRAHHAHGQRRVADCGGRDAACISAISCARRSA